MGIKSRIRQDPIDALREDLASIRKDIGAIMDGGVSMATDRAHDAVGYVGDAVKSVSTRTRKSARQFHRQLSHTAGERPLTTIAVSAVAGAVLVKLFDRLWSR